jgi:hypothetical protein
MIVCQIFGHFTKYKNDDHDLCVILRALEILLLKLE